MTHKAPDNSDVRRRIAWLNVRRRIARATRRQTSSATVALFAAATAMGILAGCRAGGSRGKPVNRVVLTDVGGYLEFVARDRERNQVSKVGAGNQSSKETIIEESVRLETEGYVYHPNLMEFAAAGLFGLLQFDFEDDFGDRVRRQQDNGDIIEFDVSADFLKRKPYPGSIFTRREREVRARPFQSSLQTTTTSLGLNWQYVSQKMPTNFQFSHTNVDLNPFSRNEAPGKQQNTNWRFETAYNVNDNNAFSLVLNRLSVKEEPFNLNYDSNEAILEHRLNFGANNRHRLDSELNFFDQVGSFPVRRLRWRELVNLEHTENLHSRFQLELLNRKQGNLAGVPPINETSYQAFAEIEHTLYDSLISKFQVFAQVQSFDSGLDVERYGTYVTFDYIKKNKWGVLRADYRAGILREKRSGKSDLQEILDERHTFNDPESIVLSNPLVKQGTVFVTAEDGVTIFQVGRDYIIRVRGDRTELERVPTGRILDGQLVLIDYLSDIGGDYTLDTLVQNFNLRQEFAIGITPYYRLRWQNQTLNPQTARGALEDDITSHTVGVEYRWRSTLRLSAEYQDQDSTITPFRATRLSADYTHRFKTGATGVVKARWSDISYLELQSRDRKFFALEGRYRHPITKHLTFEGALQYRNEKDTLSGDSNGIDLDLSLEWVVRQTEVRITYETGSFENNFSTNDSQTLYVQVRRRF